MLAAQILVSTWGPLFPLHVVHPFLQPGLVLQGKTARNRERGGSLNVKLFYVSAVS